MTRTACAVAVGTALAGALALPGVAAAAGDPYTPNQIHCTVIPGITTSGRPVTLAVLGTIPGATVAVKGSGPVVVSTATGTVGPGGNVNLPESTGVLTSAPSGTGGSSRHTNLSGPNQGTGTFTVTVAGKSAECQVVVQSVSFQPNSVGFSPSPTGTLAATGASELPAALFGGVLFVAIGGGLVLISRRRRAS